MLEEVARLGPGATAAALSSRLSLPRATTYRLVNLLVDEGYLVRMPDLHGFTLGRKVVELAHLAVSSELAPSVAEELRTLRSFLRAGVHLLRYDGGRVTIADEDPDFPALDLPRLERDPSRSAAGRLLLAERRRAGLATEGMTEAEADHVLRSFDRDGFLSQSGGFVVGFGCVAVPIRRGLHEMVGCVAVSAPSSRLTSPDHLALRLHGAAERMAPALLW